MSEKIAVPLVGTLHSSGSPEIAAHGSRPADSSILRVFPNVLLVHGRRPEIVALDLFDRPGILESKASRTLRRSSKRTSDCLQNIEHAAPFRLAKLTPIPHPSKNIVKVAC